MSVEVRILAVYATFCCMILSILHVILAVLFWRFVIGGGGTP